MPELSCAEEQPDHPDPNHWSHHTSDPGPGYEAERSYSLSRQILFLQALRGDTLSQYLEQIPWYAMPNDLIGGWCIMPVPLTPGTVYVPEVADFLSERNARYMVNLHNARLDGSK